MGYYFVIGFVLGVVIGAGIALLASYLRARTAGRQMRESFTALAAEALDANARRLGEQAGDMLEGKKALIDQSVSAVKDRLEEMGRLLHRVETERKQDFGSLSSSISSLAGTTGELHKMLASTQRRGAWGERMAEDVLRLVGMQEGINYKKQSSEEVASGRPDFTFYLPNDLKANMDVKFPLESYKAYVDAETDEQRNDKLKQLVQAVRGHIRAVASRGYIDPKVPTVPYVIVFIPNEQVYSTVLGAEPDLMDEALGKNVVLASPLTLYAMLAVIRQAAENANIMKTADQVTLLLSEFKKQWINYNIELDKLGQRIDQAGAQFQTVRNTRTNMLQRPLDRIEDLRQARGLANEQEGPAETGEPQQPED